MTQQYGDPTSPQTQRSTPEVARNEAADVARVAADKGGAVASTVGEQANRVASETGQQARNLLHEGREQLTGQARHGQQRAADGLHTVATQLRQMAENGDEKGVVSEVARQAADRTHSVASWLERREPGDLVNEVRRFARRKPGVFLLGAALAGVAVGRLTRGAVAARSDDSGTDRADYRGQEAQIPRQPVPPPVPRYETAAPYATTPVPPGMQTGTVTP